MRIFSTLMFLVVAALAGCIDDEPADEPLEQESTGPVETPTKETLTASGMVPVGLDPFNFVTGEPCSTAASSCEIVPFTLDAKFKVDPLLTWMTPASDLDLYLYSADGQAISQEGINNLGDPPENQHDMPPVSLAAGDYEFRIAFWAAAAENWELTATFEYDGPAPTGNGTAEPMA